jgi:hypothetical protein
MTTKRSTNKLRPEDLDLEPGQEWVWMGGYNPPRWEVRGTGVAPTVEVEIARLHDMLTHWKHRAVGTAGAVQLIKDAAEKLGLLDE